jgi:deoxyribodipyrimidine photolyase
MVSCDLRLHDNEALIDALDTAGTIFPVFCDQAQHRMDLTKLGF